MSICTNCPKRKTCVELCPKAEKMVNQDHVSFRESTKPTWLLELISVKVKPLTKNPHNLFSEPEINFTFLTKLQNKILHLFYFEGKTYAQIAVRTNYKVRAVEHRLSKARARIVGFYSDSKENF